MHLKSSMSPMNFKNFYGVRLESTLEKRELRRGLVRMGNEGEEEVRNERKKWGWGDRHHGS
jgi:hypothetical protein